MLGEYFLSSYKKQIAEIYKYHQLNLKQVKKQISNLIFLVLALPFLFAGCQKNDDVTDMQKSSPNTEGAGLLKSTINYCGTPMMANLVDFEETFIAGTATIGNDFDKLYVSYELNGDWWIQNAVLFAGPADSAGLIHPDGSGQFAPWYWTPPYRHDFFPWDFTQTHTFEVDLNTLDDCFIIVAYIKSKNLVTNQSKYIWGKSVAKLNGYYLDYCKQTCGPPPLGGCESSYAYGGNYATCFLNVQWLQGDNWGWTNGRINVGTYTWPIYAKANDCDIQEGMIVGNVTVNYNTCHKVIVTYNVLEGYELSKTHLFVGWLPFPIYQWHFTTNPNHFPYKHLNLNGATTDTYTICGAWGKLYVIAEAEVCDAD